MQNELPGAETRYSTPAILFHWVVAALIVTNVVLAWIWDDPPTAADRQLIALHISIGLTVLLIVPWRLVWRVIRRPPALPVSIAARERRLAHAVHWCLYIVMFGLPLSGWLMVSTRGQLRPVPWFGLFDWPVIPFLSGLPGDVRHDWHETFEGTHGVLAKVLYLLVGLHVIAVIKHHFLDRSPVLPRMLPGRAAARADAGPDKRATEATK